ncbi:MAG: tetratricopeptide repeat protein [Thermoplasmata archaeon]|nr:tetratricopeptide repeat protein [Thermoplasmata archaeon]
MINKKNKSEKFFQEGMNFFKDGKYIYAKRKFDFAIKYDDNKNPFYHYYKAKALFSLNRKKECLVELEDSIIYFNEKIRSEPNVAKYYNGRAEAFELLVKRFDLEVDTLKDLGIDLLKENFFDDTDKVITKMMSIFKKIIDDSEISINLEPTNLDFKLHKAKFYSFLASFLDSDYSCKLHGYFEKTDLIDDAINECNVVLMMDSKNTKALMIKGEIYQDLNKYNESLEEFDKVLAIDPFNIEAIYSKGYSLLRLGKYEESIIAFDKVIEKEPKNYLAHSFKGRDLYYLVKYEESIKEFDLAISISPKDYFTYLYKGDSLIKMNKKDEALKEYNKAIRIAPYSIAASDRKVLLLKEMNKQKEMNKEISRAFNANICSFDRKKK